MPSTNYGHDLFLFLLTQYLIQTQSLLHDTGERFGSRFNANTEWAVQRHESSKRATAAPLEAAFPSFTFGVLIVPRSRFVHVINEPAELLERGRQPQTKRNIYPSLYRLKMEKKTLYSPHALHPPHFHPWLPWVREDQGKTPNSPCISGWSRSKGWITTLRTRHHRLSLRGWPSRGVLFPPQ